VDRTLAYRDEEKLFLPQWTWVSDADGAPLLDYIGRFERLQASWDEICDRLGRPRSVLPHLKSAIIATTMMPRLDGLSVGPRSFRAGPGARGPLDASFQGTRMSRNILISSTIDEIRNP